MPTAQRSLTKRPPLLLGDLYPVVPKAVYRPATQEQLSHLRKYGAFEVLIVDYGTEVEFWPHEQWKHLMTPFRVRHHPEFRAVARAVRVVNAMRKGIDPKDLEP